MLLNLDDDDIKNHVRIFFNEINNKGNNVIFNIIPKALARLSKDYKNLDYHEFETIARILIKYIDKDKLIDGLVNKLFVKLKNSTELVEWRNATFILSLLNYRTEKIMINFVDTYNSIKEKVDDDEIVKDNLKVIFNKFHKIQNVSLPAKEYLDTYEKKIIKGKNVLKENKNNSQGKENKIVNNKRRRSPQNTNKDTKDNRSAKKSKLIIFFYLELKD
jgi:hypothetical protein